MTECPRILIECVVPKSYIHIIRNFTLCFYPFSVAKQNMILQDMKAVFTLIGNFIVIRRGAHLSADMLQPYAPM